MERHRVEPGTRVDLGARETRYEGPLDKGAGKQRLGELNGRLEVLQELLYAEGKHRLLVVLQATDTGGKDGTIRHVFDGTNPQGVTVTSFKRPTAEELAHDYLWRVHPHVPADGMISIFNRSHYEDVLVVRVHGLVPGERWSKRYDHINAFERMLADEGTTIRKFFLHLSREEQAERLRARLADPTKHWKFSLGDLDERKRWADYQAAFAEMLERTSTDHAPWYVVPADRKWFARIAVAAIIAQKLMEMDPQYPTVSEAQRQEMLACREVLLAEAGAESSR